MDAPTNQNNNNEQDIETDIQICSQPNPIAYKSNISNKRQVPESPDNLPATLKQVSRQIRRRNSVADLRDLDTKKAPSTRKTMTDKVMEVLSSPDVLNQIIPLLAQKIGETLSNLIETQVKQSIDSHIKPLLDTVKGHEKSIESLENTIDDQAKMMQEQDSEIDQLHRRVCELEIRLENQEQYSRRTSLRFHNIKVPLNNQGKIAHPVDTDQLVLDVCNTKLGLNLKLDDISRSHVIGKLKNGKSQVIVRFISYRTRNKVYTMKRALKEDPDGIFITENLTTFRTALVKRLAQLKHNGDIHAYWTADGRIYAMKSETSRKKLINNFDDIANIERS